MLMNARFRFDHAVIMVDDLKNAVADYQTLGFTVLPGGAHENNPSHNALISLADGSYLELFALRDAALHRRLKTAKRLGLLKMVVSRRTSIVQRFLHNVVLGEGLADFAYCPNPFRMTSRRPGSEGFPSKARRRAGANALMGSSLPGNLA